MTSEKEQTHYQRLQSMYYAAPVNAMYKPSMVITRGGCRIEIALREQFCHSGGTAHGSVYFKMLDDAAFFAANSLNKQFLLATASFSLHFIRPVREGKIIATGEVVQRGKLLTVAEAGLFDEKDRLVAKGSGSFVPTKTALADATGYGEALSCG